MKELQTLKSLSSLLCSTESNLQEIIENRPSFYGSFKYKKADGSEREITPPKGELKRIQSLLHKYLKLRITFKKCVNGGVPHRSIMTNALPHVGKSMVARLDIQGFFPNTKEEYVKDVFLRLGCEPAAAKALCGLTTFKNSLPQGSPTSVFMGNIILLPLDDDFLRLSKKHGLAYTRFVDDMTISANGQDLRSYKSAFEGIIKNHGYVASEKKTIFMGRSSPQIVTGLIVNDKLRPAPWFTRELKHTILECWPEKAGVLKVALAHNSTVNGFKASLQGKVAFVRSVEKKIGNQLQMLMSQIKWAYSNDERLA